MTAQPDVPVSLVRASEFPAPSIEDMPARMLGSARQFVLHGLAVLGVAILLGIAEALSLWMGTLVVGAGLLLVGALVALAGFLGRLGVRPDRWWS